MRTSTSEVLHIPPCFSNVSRFDRNTVRQLLDPGGQVLLKGTGQSATLARDGEQIARLVAGPGTLRPGERGYYVGRKGLQNPSLVIRQGQGKWVGDLDLVSPKTVAESWIGAVRLPDDSETTGLRAPQRGALHAVLAHWTTGTDDPATVVLPTGTGKTDTMIALTVIQRPTCLLVLVPSDALRTQIAEKFERLGILRSIGVVAAKALHPVVGRVRHAFSSPETALSFARSVNVIVATPSALFASPPEVLKTLLDYCSHLFVDEAHHVEARTWRRIRDAFSGKPVVQFTATPYREDGRRLSGRIIYAYPLGEAQREGYFSKINYVAVTDLLNPDRRIAQAAVDQLRTDLSRGLDHLLMARTNRVARAREIKALYDELAPEFNPVLLHHSLTVGERRAALQQIMPESGPRKSRIVVCVDMLGEGFDLPELKIAALHDVHKSLGVTLQFIGRFSRTNRDEIGEATVIATRPEGRHNPQLSRLYAEDPDWNAIIREVAEVSVSRERRVSEFERGFAEDSGRVPLRNVRPKMSAVVYKTHCRSWRPELVAVLYEHGSRLVGSIHINERERVAWYIVESHTPIGWGESETVTDITYDLYILYWDEKNQLLYINSSNTNSLHEDLARAVCGGDVARVQGEVVYRAMSGIKRLVPTTVGLLDVRDRRRRFSMYVGADVVEGFPTVQAQTKMKTNLFGHGFEAGNWVSIGVSAKGRIWSRKIASSVRDWTEWCDGIGRKLTDETVDLDALMRSFIRPEVVTTRPPYVPLALEWPSDVLRNTSEETYVRLDTERWPLIDVDLRIREFRRDGPIRFDVVTPMWNAPYEIQIGSKGFRYRALSDEVRLVSRLRERNLSGYFQEHGLNILLEQDAMVVPPGFLLKPDRKLPPYNPEDLHVMNWDGVDIRRESQGPERDPRTVQARAIDHLSNIDDWDIIIDDDGTGEVADIVALRAEDDKLSVALVHCKYSLRSEPGGRVTDLYEVCGQAQRSTRWRRDLHDFFRQLVRRERERLKRGVGSGLIVGEADLLYDLYDSAWRITPSFTIIIAQPGLSKRRATQRQLDLLAATEVYVSETMEATLEVWCSP